MKTGGVVVLVIFLLLVAGCIGYIVFARMRAQRLGLPPPAWASFIPFYSPRSSYGVQPAPGGVTGWINDRWRSLKSRGNQRTAAGAYEGGGSSGRAARSAGFGPLDPDDAWDSRVGAEADAYYYNEEQELGLHGQPPASNNNSSRLNVTNTAYLGSGSLGGSSYDMNLAGGVATEDTAGAAEERGRSRGRSSNRNPFDDDAASSRLSLRGVSPRPMEDSSLAAARSGPGAAANRDSNKPDDSPTERRSVFHENV